MKKLTLFSLTCLVASLGVLLASPIAHAQDSEQKKNLCGGANLTLSTGGNDADGYNRSCTNPAGNEGNPETGLNKAIKLIVNLLTVIVGVVAVIVIIISGLRYITSGGDSSNITKARNSILYALIGLIIVAIAQLLVRFIITKTEDATGFDPGLINQFIA